jgi:hypothetical protein
MISSFILFASLAFASPLSNAVDGLCNAQIDESMIDILPPEGDFPFWYSEPARLKGRVDDTVLLVNSNGVVDAVVFLIDSRNPKNRYRHSRKIYHHFIHIYGEPREMGFSWVWDTEFGAEVHMGSSGTEMSVLTKCVR